MSPSDAREVASKAMYNAAWQGGIVGRPTGETAWDVATGSERDPYYRRVDAILGALTEAGIFVGRLEQVGRQIVEPWVDDAILPDDYSFADWDAENRAKAVLVPLYRIPPASPPIPPTNPGESL